MATTQTTAPSTAAAPLIECTDVSRVYPGGDGGWFRSGTERPSVTALSDVSLAVERGGYVSLIGPSGSGKTTLLHLLGALDTPTTGTVTFDGQNLAELSNRARTKLRLDRIGLVFQRFHLLPSLTARSNVALPLLERGVGTAERRRRAADLLDRVGLGDRLEHRPGELSGGEQQRVAIARALANDPDVLLADEPTGELDTGTGETILGIFEDLAEERAVVVASHDERVAAAAQRVLTLRDGRLEADT